MTRDQFAAAAIQGLLSNPGTHSADRANEYASAAYSFADAMITASAPAIVAEESSEETSKKARSKK